MEATIIFSSSHNICTLSLQAGHLCSFGSLTVGVVHSLDGDPRILSQRRVLVQRIKYSTITLKDNWNSSSQGLLKCTKLISRLHLMQVSPLVQSLPLSCKTTPRQSSIQERRNFSVSWWNNSERAHIESEERQHAHTQQVCLHLCWQPLWP